MKVLGDVPAAAPGVRQDLRRQPRGEIRTALAAVLLDRDGTLVFVPYNGDPDRVVPLPGARAALDRLRRAGIPTAVVSNQSGVARGLLAREQVDAVDRRVEEILGPLGPFVVCMHGDEGGCACRKPKPGLVPRPASALGVEATGVVDIGTDVEAATAPRPRCARAHPRDKARRDRQGA